MILDLFAGPGGWSEGLRMLGLSDVGIEWDAAACATRAAAGHLTIRADVAQYPTAPFAGRVTGLIASPPCQDFSVAGKMAGRSGDRGQLIDTVPVWVDALRPEWIACEQVPPALEVWQEHALTYRSWGYSTWTGILNAADFGVPQTRRRAFLLASRVAAAVPPAPTHDESPQPSFFGELAPWVSMAEALGWDEANFVKRERSGDRSKEGFDPRVVPAQAMTSKARSWEVQLNWAWVKPATTVAGDPRITARCHHEEGSQGTNAKTTEQVRAGDYEGTEPIRLTLAEALTLQSFRPDYPVQGSRTKQFEQIGNAVPPLLAAHVIGALVGQTVEVAA